MDTMTNLASAAALSLLHSLWQLALLAWLAAFHFAGLRSASASTRHAVGMGWLLAMAAAPVITFVHCWHAMAPAGTSTAAWFGPGASAGTVDPARTGLAASALCNGLLACMAEAWLLGVVLMVARQWRAWRALRRMELAPFEPLPLAWLARLEVLRRAMGISRSVQVRVQVRMAERVMSPFTAHVLRPLVWLPLALVTQLPREQVEALLAHELAHIRRLDWCWNMVQCAVEAVLFHHPAVWWLGQRIREEREHACDDLAVAVCGDPVALAEALAALQRRPRDADAPRLALAARGGFLMRRIARLLSSPPARPGWRWPGALLLLLCSGTLLAVQLVPPASILTNLRYDASSQGDLSPGNFREFTASYLGARQRHYRIDMDASGQVHEAYSEGGQGMPIDGHVRSWLKTVSSMNASTQPAATPTPIAEVAPSDSDGFKTLMRTLAADPQVVARIGQPVTLDRQSFHGHVHLWGLEDFHLWGLDDAAGGKAAFTATFAGPGGRVDVAWSGKTVAGVWKADSMVLGPAVH